MVKCNKSHKTGKPGQGKVLLFSCICYKDNVAFLRRVQKVNDLEMYVGGLIGCRGDAYTGAGCLSLQDACDFHKWEISFFKRAEIDFLYAALIPCLDEAAGIALAIQDEKIPYIISFTIKKDGCLAEGTPVSEAIKYIDTTAVSFEELDGSKELKTSDPKELAESMLKLREIVPLKIFGGCCGTDGRHMTEIAKLIL
ncbi:MAG: homocysteine S-methyltransferase family protein [Lachnospiraceae bacterium]|jgi:Homocysteine/selenocysteine methylase (S-methylmethionine-dependent)|nr:homocysteine S-methyltransferase family protein [Lachnospiraceae bacterium]